MDVKEAIEILANQIDDYVIGDYCCEICEVDCKDKECPFHTAIETVLSELEEHEKTLDIFDEREYRKKYLEEERAKRPKLLYPDADEIYQRYFQQREELEKKETLINTMQAEFERLEGIEDNTSMLKYELAKKDKIIDEMADKISSIMTGVTAIQNQFEEEYCEFIKSDKDCCWKTGKECKDCIKEYFTKKVEGK